MTDLRTTHWQIEKLGGGQDSVVSKAIRNLTTSEMLIQKWAPRLLKMVLDQILWKESDYLSIRTLWEQLCTYCYLPRISGWKVLEESIREGLSSGEYFGYAAGVENDRFVDLKYKAAPGWIDKSGFLVKVEAAKKHIAAEEEARRAEEEKVKVTPSSSGNTPSTNGTESSSSSGTSSSYPNGGSVNLPDSENTKTQDQISTHFSMSAKLDYLRINKSVQQIVEEILSHINDVDGVNLSIRLDVDAVATKGFSQDTIRTVIANGDALKISDIEFNK